MTRFETLAKAQEWVLERRCQDRRRDGRCNCSKGKSKKNPCEFAEQLAAKIQAEVFNDGMVDIHELIAFVIRKKCRNSHCNHRGCINADNLITLLQEIPLNKVNIAA